MSAAAVSPSARSQPASSYTLVSAALSTWGKGSSERKDAMNSALTRSAWVCSGNRRPSPSAAGSSGLRPAAIASGSPGRIRTTWEITAPAPGPAAPGTPGPASRAAISRYSALAGSTTSHGIPALVAASSSARTVCDFPDPVAPLTNTCRFSESSGSASGPAGLRFRSRISPTVIAARPAAGSWATSKSGRSASRIPGISRSGGRVSAATSSLLA